MKLQRIATSLLLPLALVGSLYADSVKNLSSELVELRLEVERIHDTLDEKKASHKAQMKSLRNQKSELEANIRREETKIKQVQRSLEQVRTSTAKISKNSKVLQPILLDAIVLLENYINSTLPFKKAERLSALNEIKTQILSETIVPERLANRVWSFFEDEIRLSRENGIYKQMVEVNGENRLSEVAKIGMMMLFYKTSDEETGYLTRDNGAWKYVSASEIEDAQILALFDAFTKQIRSGYFILPNAIITAEVK
jgi:hypothetical protein